jgi:hypothetical protein
MSDVEESKSKQANESQEVPDDEGDFFKHEGGIETFAQLKERLRLKTGSSPEIKNSGR